MKHLIYLLLISSLLFGCSNNETSENIVSISRFQLPDKCHWSETLDTEKIYSINSKEDLHHVISNYEKEINLDINFEDETLLLVHLVSRPLKSVDLKLLREDSKSYTYCITLYYPSGVIEDKGELQYFAIKTPKIGNKEIINLQII